MNRDLTRLQAMVLIMIVVLAWGINWTVTKLIVQVVPPLWTSALRCWIACLALLPPLWMGGNLIVPKKSDATVVVPVAFLHIVAFSALVAAGLKYVPASKAIVLGYTTPLWVAVGAPFLLGEKLTQMRLAGLILGLLGLAVIFAPASLDWQQPSAIIGSGFMLLASFCWAIAIIYVRHHSWTATSLQLLFWQILFGAVILSAAAMLLEEWPRIHWNRQLILLLLYGGIVSTVLGFWAMSVVNRNLPALTTSLGLLATPLVGILTASLVLRELIDLSLALAAALILSGVALGTLDGAKVPATQPDEL